MLLCPVPAGSAGDEPHGARAAQRGGEGGRPHGAYSSRQHLLWGMCSPDCPFSFFPFALLICLDEAPSPRMQDALSLLLD